MQKKNLKGYCIRMPIDPELGITAPCKLWCTLVALFKSCKEQEQTLSIAEIPESFPSQTIVDYNSKLRHLH